ncbi:MAG: hypothetical protein JWN85_149 [Gammaproteobacteria bacterium]|nr:hypothetical protein [Gammaproteobacteria bacterium]
MPSAPGVGSSNESRCFPAPRARQRPTESEALRRAGEVARDELGYGRSKVRFSVCADEARSESRPQQASSPDCSSRQHLEGRRAVGALALATSGAATIVLMSRLRVQGAMFGRNAAVVYRTGVHDPSQCDLRGTWLRSVGRSRNRDPQPNSQLKGQQGKQNTDERLRTHAGKRTQFPHECRSNASGGARCDRCPPGGRQRSGYPSAQCRCGVPPDCGSPCPGDCGCRDFSVGGSAQGFNTTLMQLSCLSRNIR